jgi:hypothetical protein
MKRGNPPPDLKTLICERAYNRFGVKGLVIIGLLIAVFTGYLKWDSVSKLPGISQIVFNLSRRGIPQADPNRFSILVAHFEYDSQCEYERLIIEELKEFEGIQVLSLDRTISLKGSIPEEQEKRGQGKALDYLKKSGSNICIWGTVLSLNGRTLPKLYWSVSRAGIKGSKRYNAPSIETQPRLPVVFWSDLAEILRLIVTSYGAEYSSESRYISDHLPSFIDRKKWVSFQRKFTSSTNSIKS